MFETDSLTGNSGTKNTPQKWSECQSKRSSSGEKGLTEEAINKPWAALAALTSISVSPLICTENPRDVNKYRRLYHIRHFMTPFFYPRNPLSEAC